MGIKNKINISNFWSLGLAALLLSPVLFFFLKAHFFTLPEFSRWRGVLIWTFLQAFLSAAGALVLGLLGVGALSSFKPRVRVILEVFCLGPALLPPLVCVLSWVQVWELFAPWAPGLSHVVTAHVFMNMGLVCVFLSRLFCLNAPLLWAFAQSAGVSKKLFLIRFLFYEMRKDLIFIFWLVFSVCFVSFSVPLLAGGGRGRTLEVLIAEKLKDPALWPEAGGVFGVEVLFLALLFLVFYTFKKKSLDPLGVFKNFQFSYSKAGVIWPLIPGGLLVLGLIKGMSVLGLQDLIPLKGVVLKAGGQSLMVGMGAGLGAALLLSWALFCLQSGFLRKFLMSYAVSSTAFMGFCFLVLGSDHFLWVMFKWTAGLSLLFFPALYRLMGESLAGRAVQKVRVAELMGAGALLSFVKIVWPGARSGILFLSGVGAFWAVGDFAYSGLVGGGEMNLALLIQDVFASYRLELAGVLNLMLLLIGALCFLFFVSLNWLWE